MKTKMNIEISEAKVLAFLENLNTDDIIILHNLFCELNSLGSKYIHHNTEDGILEAFDHEPKEIVWGMKSTLYNPKDKYFSVLDNGKMVSYEYASIQYNLDLLAKSIFENFDHYKAFIRFDIRMM